MSHASGLVLANISTGASGTKRESMENAPISGPQLEKIAPSAADASAATIASGLLRATQTTRSPGPTPSACTAAASLETRARRAPRVMRSQPLPPWRAVIAEAVGSPASRFST